MHGTTIKINSSSCSYEAVAFVNTITNLRFIYREITFPELLSYYLVFALLGYYAALFGS